MTYNPQWVDNSILDPTKFGNWVLVAEYNLSSESLDETITWDGEQNDKIRIELTGDDNLIQLRINGDTGSNYPEGSVTQDGSSGTFDNTTRSSIYLGSGDGVVGFSITEGYLKNLGERRAFLNHYSRYISGNPDALLLQRYSHWGNTVDDVTSITLFSSGVCANCNVKVYRWQDIVPVELHSLELVAEYNLSSESLDENITWDGEQDDYIRVECSGDFEVIGLQINGDTASNYLESRMNVDGSSIDGSQTSRTAIFCTGATGEEVFTITEGNFKNNGFGRCFINQTARYVSTNTDSNLQMKGLVWDNDTDDVTSIRLYSVNGSSNVGNIKVYRRAKTSILSTAPDALHGLELSSVDASGSINVAPGSVEIKGKNIHLQTQKSVDVFTDLRSGDSVSGSQYVYAYAYDDNNTVNIEFSTTQPTKDRYGNTVTLNSDVNYSRGLYHANDPTRRYIGQVYVESGGSTIREFDVCYPGYCKGSWTPVAADADSGGNTSTTGIGKYIKRGPEVQIWGNLDNISTAGMTGGNQFKVQGFPYQSNVQAFGSCGLADIDDSNNDAYNATIEVIESTSAARLRNSRDNGALGVFTVNDLTSGSADVKFQVTYMTDEF